MILMKNYKYNTVHRWYW